MDAKKCQYYINGNCTCEDTVDSCEGQNGRCCVDCKEYGNCSNACEELED